MTFADAPQDFAEYVRRMYGFPGAQLRLGWVPLGGFTACDLCGTPTCLVALFTVVRAIELGEVVSVDPPELSTAWHRSCSRDLGPTGTDPTVYTAPLIVATATQEAA